MFQTVFFSSPLYSKAITHVCHRTAHYAVVGVEVKPEMCRNVARSSERCFDSGSSILTSETFEPDLHSNCNNGSSCCWNHYMLLSDWHFEVEMELA